MNTPGYEHDIFISYSRRGETRYWVREHFQPALTHCLAMELNRDPKIYFDQDLRVGATWPRELAHNLARSKVLMSLWTRNYLASDWCTLELSHMLSRERAVCCRSEVRPYGIIAIPIIHDGETIPPELRMVQTLEIKKYFNPRMDKYSKRAEELYDVIQQNAEYVADLIRNAPEWSAEWSQIAVNEFYDLFKLRNPSQELPPRFTR